MLFDDIKNKIDRSQYSIIEIKDISYGKQLKISNGTIINCYNNGNHNLQGKNTDEIEKLLSSNNIIKNQKIFVVYGHDDMAKLELEALLR